MHGNYIVQWEDGRTTIEKDNDLERFKKEFIEKNLDKIKHVEFNKKIYLKDFDAGKVTASATEDWGQQIVEAQSVWNQGIHGNGVSVGIVDAAVSYSHPQLNGRLQINYAETNGITGVDDDNNGYIDDEYGWDFVNDRPNPNPPPSIEHGSHVAGIVAAEHGLGYAKGIAPSAKIIPASFIGTNGGDIGKAIEAINYVANRGAKIINASWGGPGCSQALSNTLANLTNRVLFVVASGNSGLDLDRYTDYPASFNHINQITVAATRSTDFITSWSNTSFSFVHLAAPGEVILSTIPNGYKYLDGTSMAAPFVSGAAALLWSAKPQATVSQIKQAILSGVDVDTSKGYRVGTRGRLNVRKALDQIRLLVP